MQRTAISTVTTHASHVSGTASRPAPPIGFRWISWDQARRAEDAIERCLSAVALRAERHNKPRASVVGNLDAGTPSHGQRVAGHRSPWIRRKGQTL
jgi:hypothetical protein